MKNKIKIYGILFIVGAIFGMFFGYCFDKFEADEKYESHKACYVGDVINGIDVSYYQGDIDWNKVKKDKILFGFARTSDGALKVDTKFDKNWKGMKEAGIIRGAYQFFRPNQDALEQAKLMVKQINEAGGIDVNDLPCVIDIEVNSGQPNNVIIAKINEWISFIKNETGKIPIIYTGPYFWETNNLGNEFDDYPLWTAHYTSGSCPLIPSAWMNWIIWQYSDSGRVSGINIKTDMNIYNGSLDDLLGFIRSSNIDLSDDASCDVICNADVVGGGGGGGGGGGSDADVNADESVNDVALEKDSGIDSESEILDGDIYTNNGCQCSMTKVSNDDAMYFLMYMASCFFLINRRFNNKRRIW